MLLLSGLADRFDVGEAGGPLPLIHDAGEGVAFRRSVAARSASEGMRLLSGRLPCWRCGLRRTPLPVKSVRPVQLSLVGKALRPVANAASIRSAARFRPS